MITVIGGGAIGATIGAALARAGKEVDIVDADAGHVEAINTNGLMVHGSAGSERVTVGASLPEDYTAPIRTAVLAVKAQHTRAAVEGVMPLLTPDAAVVVTQNGLGAFTVGEMIGEQRTLGSLVNIAADVTAPGEVRFYGFGSLVLGRVGEQSMPRFEEITSLLGLVGEVETTDDLRGLLWNKLAFGAVLSATALDHAPQLDTILAHPDLVRGLLTEVFAVAAAEHIVVPAHDHLDPALFTPDAPPEKVRAAIADWVEYQRPHQKPQSGIYRDLAVRRRKTEVTAHFADILRLGAIHGVDLPLVTRLGDLIIEAEQGTRSLGPHNISELEGILR